MPSYKPTRVHAALTSKVASRVAHRKHVYYSILDTDGTVLGETHISHGNKDIGDANIGRMARQINIPGPVFRSFIECTVSGDDLLTLLRNQRP